MRQPTSPLTWRFAVCPDDSPAADVPAFPGKATDEVMSLACLETCEALHCHHLFFVLDERLLSVHACEYSNLTAQDTVPLWPDRSVAGVATQDMRVQ